MKWDDFSEGTLRRIELSQPYHRPCAICLRNRTDRVVVQQVGNVLRIIMGVCDDCVDRASYFRPYREEL